MEPLAQDRVLLLVDLSYQCYRAAAAHPMLTSRRVFTGGLYGFLTTFAKMVRETRATEVAICSDRKPYLRSEVYPEYKQIRKKNADDELLKMFTTTTELVVDTLEVAGIPVWGVDGFESDDLMAHAAKRGRNRYQRIYLGSNDSDLYQTLCWPAVAIYTKGINELMTAERLFKETGLTPEQYSLTTALTGTHNDIEGIRGVGPKTAAKAVLDPILMRQMRARHAAVIDRNIALIKLPHVDLPVHIKIPELWGPFNRQALYRQLDKYDIDTTASMVSAFEVLHGK